MTRHDGNVGCPRDEAALYALRALDEAERV
jgi:hypothetical protein